MRKLLLATVGAAAILGLGLAGWYYVTVGRYMESTDDAYIQADISVISPRVGGYIRTVKVVDNQRVHAGDVLYMIDDRDYAAKVAQADAAVATQQAAIAGIVSKLELERSLIDQADASMAAAKADRTRTASDISRYQNLAGDGIVSRQKVETADADDKKAAAATDKARAAQETERRQIPVLTALLDQARAELNQAKAQADLARVDLDNTVIRAPIDGVIGNRTAEVGQYVKTGTQIVSVVPLPAVHVIANFKETQLDRMRVGQSVEVTIDAYPGVRIAGRLDSFSPASGSQWSLLPPENATGNFTKIVQRVPVRITLPADNPLAGLIRPGLSVEARIDTRDAAAPTLLEGVFGAVEAKAVSQAKN
jgi:membrane fusion protein (multidrug efflux system)